MFERLAERLLAELKDPRTGQQRSHDDERIARQVRDIDLLRRDPAKRQELLDRIQDRRRGRGDLLEFTVVPRRADQPEATETLVVAGRLLVKARDDNDVLRERLEDQGFHEVPLECQELAGLVVSFAHPSGGDGARLGQVVADLKGSGVSADHIAPLAPVIKGVGGPEPVAEGAPFRPARKVEPKGRVRVAVIDTGIDGTRRADGWLAEVPRNGNVDPLDAFPAGKPDRLLDLAAGHGTFAAGIVRQVAPEARIAVYRAMDSEGIGSETRVACAMVRAVREGAQILNLSLGTTTVDGREPVALTAALEAISQLPGGDQVLVVAAAGNNGDTARCWPAAFAETDRRVVAVAGLTQAMKGASWSTHGEWVTCSTVGEGVVSTFVQGQESSLSDPKGADIFGADAWAAWSGTSFAAPQFAGAVAREMEERGGSPRAAFARVRAQGVELVDYGTAVELIPFR